MKFKNGEIYQAVEPMRKLMNEKMPVRVSFSVAKLINKLNEPLKAIEDTRQSLIKKYGIQNGNGQFEIKRDSENFQKFQAEFSELLDQEIELVFEKVKLPGKVAATCDACHHNMDKEFEIEPITLMALEKFVEVN